MAGESPPHALSVKLWDVVHCYLLWQQAAALPADDFELHVTDVRDVSERREMEHEQDALPGSEDRNYG